jgi:hypothetical protein
MLSHRLFIKHLLQPLRQLVTTLQQDLDRRRVTLFFVFDEVSNLAVGSPDSSPFLALRRVLRCLRVVVSTFDEFFAQARGALRIRRLLNEDQ